MKKILLLFSVAGMLSLSGCNNDDNFDNGNGYDQDTVAEVFETIPLTFTAAGEYRSVVTLDPQLLEADMVLVYRLTDDPDTTLDVWELIPRTVYDAGGVLGAEIDYDYNFTQQDILLYMGSNANLADFPAYTQNQIFRVVIIPGYASNFRTAKPDMNEFKDYNAVIKKYGINDSNIKKLSVK
jgi:hypothetical protein